MRERAGISLRIDPALAERYAAAAAQVGRSRNQLMEMVLGLVVSTIDKQVENERAGMTPFETIETVGDNFVSEFISLGLANDLLREAYRLRLEDRQRRLAEGSKRK